MTGSPDPIEPDRFLAYLDAEIEAARRGRRLRGDRPPPLHARAGSAQERLAALLDRIAAAGKAGELWVAPCREVAAHVLAAPAAFEGGTTLDPTSWSG